MTAVTNEEKKKLLSKIRCFVLDMDGTIYLGNHLFPFTPTFLQTVTNTGREYCYFTNNSSKNAASYLQKLERMGIPVSAEKMLISNGVIIDWLNRHHPGQTVYLVGTPDLEEAFRQGGIPLVQQDPDLVVLGFDTTLTYEKLSKACRFVREGKPIYGVNPDFNCPVEDGFIPDCGSMAALIHASTGVMPEFFGKPSRHTLHYLLEHTGCKEEELAVIGDRLYTDIKVADGTDVTSILVLSGETQLSDLRESPVQPDMVCESLEEVTRLLEELP